MAFDILTALQMADVSRKLGSKIVEFIRKSRKDDVSGTKIFNEVNSSIIQSIKDSESVLMEARRLSMEFGYKSNMRKRITSITETLQTFRIEWDSPGKMISVSSTELIKEVRDTLLLLSIATIYYCISIQKKGRELQTAFEDEQSEMEIFEIIRNIRVAITRTSTVLNMVSSIQLSQDLANELRNKLKNLDKDLVKEIEILIKASEKDLNNFNTKLELKKPRFFRKSKYRGKLGAKFLQLMKSNTIKEITFFEAEQIFREEYPKIEFNSNDLEHVLYDMTKEKKITGMRLKENIKLLVINNIEVLVENIVYRAQCNHCNKAGGWFESYLGCTDEKTVCSDCFGFIKVCQLCGKKRHEHISIW